MTKYKNITVAIILYFIFVSFVNILPRIATNPLTVADCIGFLFLNKEIFTKFRITLFNPQYMILFLIYLYIISAKMLALVHENTSFISMYISKFSRRDVVKRVVLETICHYVWIYGVSLTMTILTSMLIAKTTNNLVLELLGGAVYLLRIIGIVCAISIGYAVISMVQSDNKYIVIIFTALALALCIDITFNISTIRYTGSLYKETQWLLGEYIGIAGILYFVQRYFKTKEDLFND